MAIERIVHDSKGTEIKRSTLLPGSKEKLSGRGFWQSVLDECSITDITVVSVQSPDKIRVAEKFDIQMTKVEKSGITYEKEVINDVEVSTGPYGLRRRQISYRWTRDNNSENQKSTTQKPESMGKIKQFAVNIYTLLRQNGIINPNENLIKK